MSLIAVAVAAALAGQDLSGDPAACVEDDASVACEQAERARLLAHYRVAPIEDEAASGAEVYRSFFYNGYGRDMVVVSFEARPDQPPVVVVSAAEGRRAQAPVSAETWDRVVSESVNADRLMVPRPVEADPEEVLICLHPWAVLVETADAPERDAARGATRRRAQNTCENDDLAVRYGFLLAELAGRSMPACDQLEPDKHRNDVSRLYACLYLGGNTVAAASLMNEKGEPPWRGYQEPASKAEWDAWLTTDGAGRLDWAGEVHQESNTYRSGQPRAPRLADVMLQRAEALPDLTIYQSEVGARDARNGWIKGQITYRASAEGEPEKVMVADYRQTWSRGDGFGWRLDDWTVGPFRPLEIDGE